MQFELTLARMLRAAVSVAMWRVEATTGFAEEFSAPLNRNRYMTRKSVFYLLKGTLVSLANFLLLVSLHLLVVEVLSSALDIVKAEFGVLFCFTSVVGKTAGSASRLVRFAVFQPGKQLRCTL